MTEKKANEILRTKYPEGRIFKRNSMGGTSSSALAVVFNPNSKVYDYQGASYQQVLEKLGFNILYKHNVEAMKNQITRLEKEIENGGYKPILDLLHRDYVEYSNEEINQMKAEIGHLKSELENAIIV